MRRFLALLFSLPLLASAQTYTPSSLANQTNTTPIAVNATCSSHPSSPITSITYSGGTATVNLATAIAGGGCGSGVGNSITVSNTYTGQDGTWTALTTNNTTPGNFTFSASSTDTFSSTFRYDHVPSMVKDLAGKIWNFWTESCLEASCIGWIMEKSSADNGNTWTTPVKLFSDPSSTDCLGGTSQCDWRNQEAGLAANGNILVAWGSHDWGATAGWQAMYYSYYNGTSWASPIAITIVPGDQTAGSWWWCSPYGATVSLPGGAIGVTTTGGITRACNPPYPAYMLISCDNGVTLGTGTGCTGPMAQYAAQPIRRITATGQTNLVTNELTLAWVGGSTLIGYVRNNPWSSGCTLPCGPMIQYVSQDVGLSWTAAVTNLGALDPGETSYTEVSPILYKPDLGNMWWLVWGDRYALSGVNHFNLESMVISPSAVIANPTGFATPNVTYVGVSGWALAGYPTAVSTGTNTFLLEWDTLGASPNLSLFTGTGSFIPPVATVIKNAVLKNMIVQ